MKKAQVPHVSQIDPSEQEKLIESEKMAAMGGAEAPLEACTESERQVEQCCTLGVVCNINS